MSSLLYRRMIGTPQWKLLNFARMLYFAMQKIARVCDQNFGTELLAVQGMLALGSLRPAALAIHVVMAGMFAAALGAHNNSEFSQLEDRLVSLWPLPLIFCC